MAQPLRSWLTTHPPRNRYPLVMVSGDDGKVFREEMRIVQGELPVQRYAGRDRSIGPQYVRGISTWADDGSRPEQVMWLVYSMNKEDIWVSRVPLPMKAVETASALDDFGECNAYQPKWSSIGISIDPAIGRFLRLENHDPFDAPRAVRVFRESVRARIEFKVMAEQIDVQTFEIELVSGMGSSRPARIVLDIDGRIRSQRRRAAG